jgi:hypothetical protein
MLLLPPTEFRLPQSNIDTQQQDQKDTIRQETFRFHRLHRRNMPVLFRALCLWTRQPCSGGDGIV